jgi:hypothetical protein
MPRIEEVKIFPVSQGTRFFLIMALIMAATIAAGFTLNLAMARSTFAVPLAYHVHALVFFAWVALYLAQAWTISRGKRKPHQRLGKLAYLLIPAMIVMGLTISVVSLRRTGGPFFFDQNEFLFSNTLLLLLFAVFAFAALRARRYSGWHRRLMLMAMTVLTGPGIGRLLPMPLLIPNAWLIGQAVTLIFPIIGMIHDWRTQGRVHRAYMWGIGAIIVVQAVASLLAYSPWGIGVTAQVLAGTPGAARPMQAFLPPDFSL